MSCCFPVTRKRDEAGLCNVAQGWAGCCIIIIKKPRNLAEKSRMSLRAEVHCTCARTTMLLANRYSKVAKGWATINALQFLQSEPWINILTVRANAPFATGQPHALQTGKKGWAKVHLDAAFAARLSDIAELENGLRQCAVETSRRIGPGSNVSSSHAKEPATGLIAAVATGAEGCSPVACRLVRPIAGVSRAGGHRTAQER
jgi:hypothetical protein